MPRKRSKKTLMESVVSGDVAAVREVVRSGVGLLDEMEDTSPLAIAVDNNDFEMVKALLDLGHDPNVGGIVLPLAGACHGGSIPIISALLEHGADINACGEEGETAMMCAAGAGKLDVMQRLIEAGANIEQRDRDGEDALDYALKGQSSAVIKLLSPPVSKGSAGQD